MLTLNKLVAELREGLGADLRSIVLYGSRASKDSATESSDVNVLVVIENTSVPLLSKVAPISKKWTRQGNPPPLLFTWQHIEDAKDVFPIEFLDIQESRQVLHGDDPFKTLEVHTRNLRHQLEFELRSKLIALRQRYLATGGKSQQVRKLLTDTLSSFLTLFRATLILIGSKDHVSKKETASALAKHVGIDVNAFDRIWALRNGVSLRDENHEQLLARLMTSVEAVIRYVDEHASAGS